jgi:hypothetical protein
MYVLVSTLSLSVSFLLTFYPYIPHIFLLSLAFPPRLCSQNVSIGIIIYCKARSTCLCICRLHYNYGQHAWASFPVRARTCKLFSGPGIDSKEAIPPGWESIPGLFKRVTNSGSGSLVFSSIADSPRVFIPRLFLRHFLLVVSHLLSILYL